MTDERRQFVVLHHTGIAEPHWDLMLEYGDTLATWRLAELPAGVGPWSAPATPIAAHRKAYLEYEGPVSGGRGAVRRVDRGTYGLVRRDHDGWEVEFDGGIFRGRFRLGADVVDPPNSRISRF